MYVVYIPVVTKLVNLKGQSSVGVTYAPLVSCQSAKFVSLRRTPPTVCLAWPSRYIFPATSDPTSRRRLQAIEYSWPSSDAIQPVAVLVCTSYFGAWTVSGFPLTLTQAAKSRKIRWLLGGMITEVVNVFLWGGVDGQRRNNARPLSPRVLLHARCLAHNYVH